MARADSEGGEALHSPPLRPATVDADLLGAVHRGLEAVPAERSEGAASSGDRRTGPGPERLARRRRV